MSKQYKRMTRRQWLKARALYEDDPDSSYATVAKQMGSTRTTVASRAKREGWHKKTDAERERAAAKASHTKADEISPDLSDEIARGDGPDAYNPYSESFDSQESEVVERKNASDESSNGGSQKATQEVTTVAEERERKEAADAAWQERTEVRSKILSRHREEANLPRRLAYEAVREKNFEKAKLAKITSETILNIHKDERQSWGLDLEGNGVIVIERT